MQTNGPVKDFARYAQVSKQQFLRPLTSGELSDASIFLYRSNFSKLVPLCLIPALCISSVFVVFSQLLGPTAFNQSESQDLVLDIFKTGLLLIGGIALSFVVALIGLARISAMSHLLVEAALKDESPSQDELEKNSQPLTLPAYKHLVKASWFCAGIVLISFIPSLSSSVFTALSSNQDYLPAIALGISMLFVPLGIVIALTRFSIALGTLAVGLSEKSTPKASLERAKYLFSAKSRPIPTSNPGASGIMIGAVFYFFLRLGYAALLSQFGISQMIISKMPSPLFRVFADTVLRIIPEFLAVLILTPYVTIAATLYYYQRRILVEGLDISTLYEKLPANRR